MYSNKTSNFEFLSKILFTLGQENKKNIIQIQDKTFFKHFNISYPKKHQLNMNMNKYIEEIKS
jgi:hypothetical protein